jgi:hypothetical protein
MASDVQSRRRAMADIVLRFAIKTWNPPRSRDDPSLEIVVAPGGGKSLVFFIKRGAQYLAAVHAFETTADARRFSGALRLAHHHNLPAPKLLYDGSNFLSYAKNGGIFVVSEFIYGETLNRASISPDCAGLLARSLGAFHNVESDKWGKPIALENGSIKSDWSRSAERRLKKSGIPQGKELSALKNWLAEKLGSIEEPNRFHLCHHHLAADDMIHDAARDRVVLIDCGSLQFSRAARDLAAVKLELFEDREEAWMKFLDAYFAQRVAADRPAEQREIEFFLVFLLLGKLRHQPTASEQWRRLARRLNQAVHSARS